MRCTQSLFSASYGVVDVRCEGFRVTPRDREIVRWIGRHRFVTAAQVAERFGVGRSQCYARLTGLVRLGLLNHERLLHGEPGVYLATRSGLELAEVRLPTAAVDLRTYEHDLKLVTLITELEQARRGAIWTERELRAVDTPSSQPAGHYAPRYAVLLGSGNQLRLTPSGAPRIHFPDAVIDDRAGHRTAIELERTVKGRSRLRQILRAYTAARHLDAVRYYTTDARVSAIVSEEIATLGASKVIKAVPWSPEMIGAAA